MKNNMTNNKGSYLNDINHFIQSNDLTYMYPYTPGTSISSSNILDDLAEKAEYKSNRSSMIKFISYDDFYDLGPLIKIKESFCNNKINDYAGTESVDIFTLVDVKIYENGNSPTLYSAVIKKEFLTKNLKNLSYFFVVSSEGVYVGFDKKECLAKFKLLRE